MAALAVLTHLPAPSVIDFSAEEKGRSLIWFPFIGAIMGVLLAAVALQLQRVEPVLASVILLTVWMFISELRHLDALARSISIWLFRQACKVSSNNVRPVNSQLHFGVMGVMALVMMIKFAALAVLIEYDAWIYIALAPVVARLLVTALIGFTTIAPGEMLVHEFSIEFPYVSLFVWLLIAVPMVLIAGAPMAAVFVMLLLIRFRLKYTCGGLTWESIGATIVLLEATALLAFALSV